MNLKDLMEFQKEFDKRHGWDWSKAGKKERLENLNYLAIALAGEVGEFCNLVKKVTRKFKSKGELPSEEEWKEMKEELVDIFIYVIKGAAELFNMDLEEEYFRKMKLNEERFKEFKSNELKNKKTCR